MTQLVKKDIKRYIYDTLKDDANLAEKIEERIYHLDEDYKRDGEDIFPMITYCRIAPAKYSDTGKRAEFFQISAWANTSMQAEDIKDIILDIFNRRQNDGFINYSQCIWVHEPQQRTEQKAQKSLKIKGIHSDYLFIFRDNL